MALSRLVSALNKPGAEAILPIVEATLAAQGETPPPYIPQAAAALYNKLKSTYGVPGGPVRVAGPRGEGDRLVPPAPAPGVRTRRGGRPAAPRLLGEPGAGPAPAVPGVRPLVDRRDRSKHARRCSRACTIAWTNAQRPKKGGRSNGRLQTVAYHEAGHAVVAIAQGLTVRVATIIPDRQRRGHVPRPSEGRGGLRDSIPAPSPRWSAMCSAPWRAWSRSGSTRRPRSGATKGQPLARGRLLRLQLHAGDGRGPLPGVHDHPGGGVAQAVEYMGPRCPPWPTPCWRVVACQDRKSVTSCHRHSRRHSRRRWRSSERRRS